MILIRYALVGLIIYLIIRLFVQSAGKEIQNPSGSGKKTNSPSKKVSKRIGEYVDYEETGK